MSCELRHGDMLSLGGCSHLSVGNFDAQIVSKTDVNYRFVVLGHPSPPRQRKRSATTTAADAAKHSATKARDPSDDKVKSPHKRARTTQNGDDDDLSGSDSIDNVSSNNDSSSSSSSSSDNQSRPMRFAVGAAVEAQSTNALTREVDAWFDATIVSVNARQGMYTVRFDSYGPEFDEKLPAQRVRLRADGEWKYAQIVEGKTRMLVQYRKRQIWYDALVLKKIADPAVVGEKVPCLHVRWLDQPIGAKPAEATTPFDTTMEFAYLPEQTW
jgi:hypothetical protein